MSELRPGEVILAADARFSRTDYTDDQIWELSPGATTSPALALQTHYGGRVGLASLVPMWLHGNQVIYQAQTYASTPCIVTALPGFARCEAAILSDVSLCADYWVMDSRAVGSRYLVQNNRAESVTLHLDLFGHVVASDKSQRLAILTLLDQTHALSMGRYPAFEPVVLLENGTATVYGNEKASPKIGLDITLTPGEQRVLRWVHAGNSTMAESLEHAQFWLGQDWEAQFARINQAGQAIPLIETGTPDLNAAIAHSYHQLLQAFMLPTQPLPQPSFVALRVSKRGYSRSGDGNDYDRNWNGQPPHLAYLAALGVATIVPAFAQGILRNYLAIQKEDGWIDFKPGLGGQRAGMMCTPLLARLTWKVYEYTADRSFLGEMYPGLLKYFQRWFAVDLDSNQNGHPSWQNERQTGFTGWPSFGVSHSWTQGADISLVETPDMAAYLLSEATHLTRIAQELGADIPPELSQRTEQLLIRLTQLWNGERGCWEYHDADTDIVSGPVPIIAEGHGDEEFLPAEKFASPAHIIIRVTGGTGRAPHASLYLEGRNSDDIKISETIDLAKFAWGYNYGIYTSRNVYAVLDRVHFTGLSRVYKVNVDTVDLTALDMNNLLALMTSAREGEIAHRAIQLLTDEHHFWRQNGAVIVSMQDQHFDPANGNIGGGVWPFWVALIAEALLTLGQYELAKDVAGRLMNSQASVFKASGQFNEFYHPDVDRGLGEEGHLGGIVPVYLLREMFGIHIPSSSRVVITGPLIWDSPIVIRQHGVTVQRSVTELRVEFPSNHVVTLSSDSPDTVIDDPNPVEEPVTRVGDIAPFSPQQATANRVIIGVKDDPPQA